MVTLQPLNIGADIIIKNELYLLKYTPPYTRQETVSIAEPDDEGNGIYTDEHYFCWDELPGSLYGPIKLDGYHGRKPEFEKIVENESHPLMADFLSCLKDLNKLTAVKSD